MRHTLCESSFQQYSLSEKKWTTLSPWSYLLNNLPLRRDWKEKEDEDEAEAGIEVALLLAGAADEAAAAAVDVEAVAGAGAVEPALTALKKAAMSNEPAWAGACD